MDIKKRNRLIAAGTIAIVLLLVVLAAVMVYQLVTISVMAKRKQELQQKIEEYYQAIGDEDGLEAMLEYYNDYDALYQLAVEYEIIKS